MLATSDISYKMCSYIRRKLLEQTSVERTTAHKVNFTDGQCHRGLFRGRVTLIHHGKIPNIAASDNAHFGTLFLSFDFNALKSPKDGLLNIFRGFVKNKRTKG